MQCFCISLPAEESLLAAPYRLEARRIVQFWWPASSNDRRDLLNAYLEVNLVSSPPV